MYSYITEELPDTVFKNFPEIDAERVSITGHSMGGHGALTLVGLIFECSPFLLLLRKEPTHGRRLAVWWLRSKRRERGGERNRRLRSEPCRR